jgi:hypothetical protein
MREHSFDIKNREKGLPTKSPRQPVESLKKDIAWKFDWSSLSLRYLEAPQ